MDQLPGKPRAVVGRPTPHVGWRVTLKCRDPAAPVLDHKEAVQQLERHRRHGEEIEGGDDFADDSARNVSQRLAGSPRRRMRRRYRATAPLRDNEAELLKLAVDLGGSPIRILLRQSLDQSANLVGDLRSAAAWPGSPAPIETEAGAVPADHGVGLHDDQDVGPAGPTMAKSRPEESVQGVQFWPRPFPFEHGDLLSEGENFEGGIASTAEEDSDGRQGKRG